MRQVAKLVGLLLSVSVPVSHGNEGTLLFASPEPFKAVLSAPLVQAYSQKNEDKRLYLEGTWSYKEQEEAIKLPLKIRTRGNYRRSICKLPPLQLNFRKGELEDTLFAGQNKLKMVSPCKNGNKYQQLIYLEYHIYQLFALISDYHLKARLVEVSYVDSGGRDKHWNSTNFLLEDDKEMARRLGMKPLNTTETKRPSMDLGQTALVEVFQLIIGNVDYSTLKAAPDKSCCHNTLLLSPEGEAEEIIPVAYDFDSSGIINAPYATVSPNVPTKSVTQRYFTGWCKEEYRYREAIAHLLSLREEAIAIFAGSSLLDDSYRKKAIKYLEKSYKLIGDNAYVEDNILGRCRGEVIKG